MECGSQCLELFSQLNWTGPPVVAEVESQLRISKEKLHQLNQKSLCALSCDGEVIKLANPNGHTLTFCCPGCQCTLCHATPPSPL